MYSIMANFYLGQDVANNIDSCSYSGQIFKLKECRVTILLLTSTPLCAASQIQLFSTQLKERKEELNSRLLLGTVSHFLTYYS